MSVFLFLVEHDRGVLDETAPGGLTHARRVAAAAGASLHAVLVGEEAEGLAGSLGAYGAETVHLARDELLTDYGPDAWAETLLRLARSVGAAAVSAVGTDRGNEVMAGVGARTGLAMAANCLEIAPGADGGEDWLMTRVRWGGSLLERARLSADMKLVTLAPHAVEAEALEVPAAGERAVFVVGLSEADTVTMVRERVTAEEGITLATAPVVVSGGRGVGGPEGFAALEELAELLGGAVGCSRVVTNNGWRNHKFQVGQTGTVVAPELYIACGISGAIQHWVGMMNSKRVLAVNLDREAPMVTKADWAVIADLHEVIPAVAAEVTRRQSQARETS